MASLLCSWSALVICGKYVAEATIFVVSKTVQRTFFLIVVPIALVIAIWAIVFALARIVYNGGNSPVL